MKHTPLTPLHKSFLYFGLMLTMFSIFRVVLFVIYRDYFGQLSGAEIAWSLWHGIRFDAAIGAIFFAVPLLLLNLPFRFALRAGWQQPLAWVLWAMTLAMGLLLAADIVYFGYVNRHIATELLTIDHDLRALVRMGLTDYAAAIAGYAAFAAALAWGWARVARHTTEAPKKNVLAFAVVLVGLILTIRGWTFYGKPINLIHAFSSGSTAAGNLTLNGVFSAVHASRSTHAVKHKFFSSQEALRIAAEDFPIGSGEYPLSRHYEARPKHPNLVFVLLESWSFNYVDALSGKAYGVTPNFDALVRQGLAFTRVYSAGQRSIEGVQATLTGIPHLMGMPHLGKGLEVTNISRLGAMARANGYRTLFAQSSRRGSFRMDAIAGAAGFEEYYGMEDVPLLLDYPDPKSSDYGWDYDTLMFVHSKLLHTRQPFLAYVYTGTTHEPFARLGARFEKRPHNSLSEDGFLNALYYADWSLGEFMKAAAKTEWYPDTIFIFAADHPLGKFSIKNYTDRFHIPLLIYAPGLIKAGTRDVIGSQLDVFPTMVDLLGFGDSFSALGESLLRKQDGYALIAAGSVVGLIGGRGYLTHSLKNRLETGAVGQLPPPSYFDALEKKLLAVDQVTYELLNQNRWATP